MKTLTVISPVYNEAPVIESFYLALKKTLGTLRPKYRSEILFILDRSSDGTIEILRKIARKDKSVRVLSLSSRFGHQMSLLAGIDHSHSDIVLMMDSDLQHPPTVIPQLLREYEKGNDIVYAVRSDTRKIGFFKKISSALFYKMINMISEVPINENAADFRLISQKVASVFREQIRERNIFLRGMISWVGFNQASVTFVAGERHSGESKYNLARMLRFGISGVLSFSKKPLQAAILVGSLFAGFALINALVTFFYYFHDKSLPSGWTTIVILISGIGGVQLIFLGILGEYLAGIFDEVKGRPHYLVQEKINIR